jgi:hypothetical protein
VGDSIEFAIPTPDNTPVHVTLMATRSMDYAIVQFHVNGLAAGPPIDFSGAANRVELSGPIELGRFTPDKGQLILRAEITGAHPESMGSRWLFGLDYVRLSKASQRSIAPPDNESQ